MKKLMIIAAAAALMSVAFGADKAKKPTFDEVKASYRIVQEIAATNTFAARKMAIPTVIVPLNARSLFVGAEYDAFCREVDDRFLALGIDGLDHWYTSKECKFPKICQSAFAKSGIETNSPYIVSLGRKYEWYCAPHSFSASMLTPEEFVGLINESINLKDGRFRPMYGYTSHESLKKKFQKACVRPVKKYLVRQGKSFVTKDGVNPCEGLMTELNTALNAPYFNGLNTWLAKIGINASIDTSHLPDEASVNQLKTDILNADNDLSAMDDAVLKICLGVDGYNAFVKKYNGEQ